MVNSFPSVHENAPSSSRASVHRIPSQPLSLAIFLIAFALYALTLAPDLTWAHWGADGGDFVAAVVAGRLPHPPGFPVYMALARVAIRLPWGTPAWRLHLLSALMAAGTVAMFAAILFRRGHDVLITFIAALSLAVAPLFWSQALIAEVYTTAAFFAVLTLALALDPPRMARRAFLGGAVWGLGLSVHPMLILLAPLWVGLRRRDLPAWAAGLLVGLLPYVLLPLFATGPQPWGDLRTLSGWLGYVTARLYGGYAFALPLGHWPQRSLAWVVLLLRQATPVGFLLAAFGILHPASQRHPRRWRTALAFGAASLVAIGYNTSDSLVYLVPFLVLPALWLAEGLTSLAARIASRRWLWLGLALPFLVALSNWAALDLRRDTEARAWWEATLAQVPAGAVLVTAADTHTFTLWYAQDALGLRPDVTVVDHDLWARSSYRAFLGVPAAEARLGSAFEDRPLCTVDATAVTCP